MIKKIQKLLKRIWILKIIAIFFILSSFFIFYQNNLHSNEEQNFNNLVIQKKSSSSAAFLPAENRTSINLDSISQEMIERINAVDLVCRGEKFGRYSTRNSNSILHQSVVQHQMTFLNPIQDPPTPNFEEFYFDRKHAIAWCPIYKAASTTWLHYFCLLGGMKKDIEADWTVITRNLWPSLPFDEAERAFRDAKMRFFIVRHPFERLLSAYRDKLEDIGHKKEKDGTYFYSKYADKIVAKYRNSAGNYAPHRNSFLVEEKEEQGPTFAEFIQYLIDINLIQEADVHWLPYYLFCTPCLLDYNAIVKFETIFRDFEYIIQKTNLTQLLNSNDWKHLTKGQQSKGVVQKYFSTLSRDQLNKLYEKYKIDFDMFGYQLSPFENYVAS